MEKYNVPNKVKEVFGGTSNTIIEALSVSLLKSTSSKFDCSKWLGSYNYSLDTADYILNN